MEINGTWYARDTIKAVQKIIDNGFLVKLRWEFAVKIIIANYITTEYFPFATEEEAEQSRK